MPTRPISFTDGVDTENTEKDTLQHISQDHHIIRRRRIAAAGLRTASVFLLVVVPSLYWSGSLWAAHTRGTSGAKSFGSDEGAGGTEAACAPTDVVGLSFCPQLGTLMPLLLEIKRGLLRLALEAVEGAGTEDPLHLVLRAAEFCSDAWYSSSGKGHPLWNEGLPKGTRFINWLDNFYVEKLNRQRPVVVFVTGRDVCSLLADLRPTFAPEGGNNTKHFEITAGQQSHKPLSTNTPLALMTVGWDLHGSPFAMHEWGQCAHAILELPDVVRWFVSHAAGRDPGPKVEYMGIGFGSWSTRNGLDQSVYINAAKERLRDLEYCGDNEAGTMDLLFMCNNASPNTPRPEINAALYAQGEEGAKVIPVNRFPMEPAPTVEASMKALFAVSPGGTRSDCFRHYEYLLAGNIVYITDSPSLRYILAGLPVVFVQGEHHGWARINCDAMETHAKTVARRLREGLKPGARPPFQFEKLTVRYWIMFVRERVWAAAAYNSSTSFLGDFSDPGELTGPNGEMLIGP